jgi:hypothetical protein
MFIYSSNDDVTEVTACVKPQYTYKTLKKKKVKESSFFAFTLFL